MPNSKNLSFLKVFGFLFINLAFGGFHSLTTLEVTVVMKTLTDLGEGSVVVLPTDPVDLGNVLYSATTFYHWPQFSANLTQNRVNIEETKDYVSINGPILFQAADALNVQQEQCLTDSLFHQEKEGSDCIVDPSKCEDGLSFSIFYLSAYEEEEEDFFNTSKRFQDEYIVSSGGEDGTPGFAIYRRGGVLGAMVSTGNVTWSVEVEGATPRKNKWSNLAIRWEAPKFASEDEFNTLMDDPTVSISDLGGLQLFVNLEPIGHVILGHVFGCSYTASGESCASPLPSPKEHFDPPEISIGCHRTKTNPNPRNYASGGFDELAIWNRRLNDTELPYFLGGHKDVFEKFQPSEILRLIEYVDLTQSEQVNMVYNIMTNLVQEVPITQKPEFRNIDDSDASPNSNISDTSSNAGNSDEASDEPLVGKEQQEPTDTSQLKQILKLLHKLSDESVLDGKEYISEEEFNIRLRILDVAGEVLDEDGKYRNEWRELKKDNSIEGSQDISQRISDFLTTLTEKRIPNSLIQSKEFTKISSTANMATEVFKLTSKNYRALGDKKIAYFKFPNWKRPEWQKVAEYWTGTKHYPPADVVQVPTKVFTGSCEINDVTFVGSMYDRKPDKGLKNPSRIFTNILHKESREITIQLTSNRLIPSADNSDIPRYGRRCQVDPKMLIRTPIKLIFSLSNNFQYRRLNSYFDDLEESWVRKRHCVIWNPDIGAYGAWDTEGVKTVYSDAYTATCYSTKLGTFSVVSEIEDLPMLEEEDFWLFVTKIVAHTISAVALLVYIGIIVSSMYLWEMFHALGLNVAIALFLGNMFFMINEMNAVRDDRELCCTFGSMMSFFYMVTACLLANDCYAIFRAMVSGIIGGRTKVYICYGWGFPLLCLGLNVYFNLHLMGNDPQCMIGWNNVVKWGFFVPMLSFSGLALILMLIVMCNIHTPAMRKESIVEELGSVAIGTLMFVFLFCITWTLAPLAYIRFHDVALPDFYPAFQVMNAFSGFLFFLFVGIGSKRFKTVIAGQVLLRKNQLLAAAKGNSFEEEEEEDDDLRDKPILFKSKPESAKKSQERILEEEKITSS